MGNGTSSHFSEYYKTTETLGTGTFATVKRCVRKSDNAEFAVKIIRKVDLTYDELTKLKDEIEILQSLKKGNHPHIVSIEEVFESETKVKIVLELCQEKHLLHLIHDTPNRRLDETKSAQIIHTIAKVIKTLHHNHIVHRDLKPENILFTEDGTLKIADFGSAYRYKLDEEQNKTSKMKTNIGTPLYVAPEVLCNNGAYSHMVDLWSLGVMLYTMLCGYHPFSSRKSIDKMYRRILSGDYKFSQKLWQNVDPDAIDLVKKLLTVDVSKRITADELLRHKWILKHCGHTRDNVRNHKHVSTLTVPKSAPKGNPYLDESLLKVQQQLFNPNRNSKFITSHSPKRLNNY